MLLRGKNLKTVFLLGAGATRGALRHVILNKKRVKPPLNGDFFAVADAYARAKGKDSADSKRLARLRHLFKEHLPIEGTPKMEEAFSLLYIAKDFPNVYRRGPGRTSASGRLQEIEDFLRLAFGIFHLLGQDSSAPTGYDRLVGKLEPGDTVITLNYDTLLDSALVRNGWSPGQGYCLGGSKQKVQWAPKSGTGNLRNVSLLKLHGSVNWYVRGSFRNLSRVFTNKPVLVSNPRRNERGGHIRQIVPPIYGKFFDHDHWRSLWDKAHKSLFDADVLVVVGCSLVATDFHLRALLSRVSQERKSTGRPIKQFILVDRVTVRRKWKRVMKGAVGKFSGMKTFEQFLSKELKA